MKSRTSSSKALGKDFGRFWPVWVGYLLFLILFQVILSNDDMTYWYAANIGECITIMGVVNGIYALVVAQMLFGDLFNPRMCNGLHCLPLKREQWFGAHITAGFLFSILPTVLMTGFSEIIIALYSTMVDGWQLPLYWLAGTNIQYIFFFGLAVFCMMCSGNRFGSTILYGIANFGSLLVYLLVDQMYTPLLKGVVTMSGPFERLSPMVHIAGTRFIDAQRTDTGRTYFDKGGVEIPEYIATFEVEPAGWYYIAILAVVGVVLLVLARLMYKKRHLECAGDFLAVRWLEPVFQVVFTVLCGSGFHAVFLLFFGLNTEFIYFIMGIGMLAGWFAGRMLLERTTRVFRPKTILGFALVAGAMALSLYVTTLDPLGLQAWVPEVDDLKGATVSIRYQDAYSSEDAEEIADMIRLHELALEQNVTVHSDYDSYFYHANGSDPNAARISLTYHLRSGFTAQREYYVLAEGESGDLIRKYFSRLDVIFDDPDIQDVSDLRHTFRKATYIDLHGQVIPKEALTEDFLMDLADAIAADCEAGNMVQLGAFHPGVIMETVNSDDPIRMMDLGIDGGPETNTRIHWYLYIYADCENTLAVLEPTGILDAIQQRYNEAAYG